MKDATAEAARYGRSGIEAVTSTSGLYAEIGALILEMQETIDRNLGAIAVLRGRIDASLVAAFKDFLGAADATAGLGSDNELVTRALMEFNTLCTRVGHTNRHINDACGSNSSLYSTAEDFRGVLDIAHGNMAGAPFFKIDRTVEIATDGIVNIETYGQSVG